MIPAKYALRIVWLENVASGIGRCRRENERSGDDKATNHGCGLREGFHWQTTGYDAHPRRWKS